MLVSYPELYALSVKVLKACNIPYGWVEEGAEIISWGEFAGFTGAQVLQNELGTLSSSNLKKTKLIYEDKFLSIIDSSGESGLLTGRLAADYAFAKADDMKSDASVYLINTTCIMPLVYNATLIARRGLGCIIHWINEEGMSVWSITMPGQEQPTIIQDFFSSKNNKIKNIIKNYIQQYTDYNLINLNNTNALFLICTRDMSFLRKLLEIFKDSQDEKEINIISADYTQNVWDQSWKYGAKIDFSLWNELNLVPSKLNM